MKKQFPIFLLAAFLIAAFSINSFSQDIVQDGDELQRDSLAIESQPDESNTSGIDDDDLLDRFDEQGIQPDTLLDDETVEYQENDNYGLIWLVSGAVVVVALFIVAAGIKRKKLEK
ncbi:MAG: hypothetical protein Kapaf2KO_10340 [Candidatus Kapaibacteriales bacterium]